jgi:preprotein translocase subunit SecG
MIYLLTFIHVVVCLFLIAVVLLQSGKAADLAGAFGGMGSQTAFGPRGSATVLSKATTIAAALFMVTSLSLSILATRNQGSASTVLDSTGATKKAAAKTPESKSGGASTPITIPGQSAPVSPGMPAGGAKDTKGFQVPEVEVGGRKVPLPAPGQPGGLIIPEGTSPEEIKRRVAAELERMKAMEAAGAAVAAPKPDAPKK